MKKYAKIIDEETKKVKIGVGCSDEYYIEIGMTLMDVEQAYTGDWYVTGFVPIEPEPIPPTDEQIRELRAQTYASEVDCITAHIQRLRDTDPMTPEVETEITALLVERDAKVAEIKARYPYNEE